MEASRNAPIYLSESEKINALMSEYLTLKQRKMEKDIRTATCQEHLADAHPLVRKRVYALKKLQRDTIELDAAFQRDVYNLERAYQGKFEKAFKKRTEIVSGEYEPSSDECQFANIQLDEEEVVPSEGEDIPRGIPNFWLNVLKNAGVVRPMIQERDLPVLQHLTNVHVTTESEPNLSFTLEFQFRPNMYFRNASLTKTYLMKCSPDDDDPFAFEGPEIYKTIGCEIQWNAGFNITEAKTEDGSAKAQSFFAFFTPPELVTVNTPEAEKIEEYLENDFEIGHYLKERVVPRAVLYFTGEIVDDEASDDEDDGESLTNFMESFEQQQQQHDLESEED